MLSGKAGVVFSCCHTLGHNLKTLLLHLHYIRRALEVTIVFQGVFYGSRLIHAVLDAFSYFCLLFVGIIQV